MKMIKRFLNSLIEGTDPVVYEGETVNSLMSTTVVSSHRVLVDHR